MSFITAFKEIRLTNINTKVSGTRLQVGNELVVYQSDTGVFVTTQIGDDRYVLASGAGYISGEKVFLTSPLVPTPTTSSGAANLALVEQASGYLSTLISAASAGVSSLNGLSGVLNIVGQGNIEVSASAGQIFVSGNTGQLASLSGDLLATGDSLNSRILNTGSDLLLRIGILSGNLTNSGVNILNYITSLSGDLQTTGNELNTKVINTGTDLLARIDVLSGNLIDTGIALINKITSLSGDLLNTGTALLELINIFSGNQQEFVTNIPTGIDLHPIIFPTPFASAPKIQATVEVTGDILYFVAVRNRTTTGYFALFSDVITEDGVSVNTYAKI